MITRKEFALRISKLRQQKNVSSRNMSLSLGQGESYLSSIENKKSYPSMQVFFYICEYFGITPMEFFDFDDECPKETNSLLEEIKKLDYKQTKIVFEVVKNINKK